MVVDHIIDSWRSQVHFFYFLVGHLEMIWQVLEDGAVFGFFTNIGFYVFAMGDNCDAVVFFKQFLQLVFLVLDTRQNSGFGLRFLAPQFPHFLQILNHSFFGLNSLELGLGSLIDLTIYFLHIFVVLKLLDVPQMGLFDQTKIHMWEIVHTDFQPTSNITARFEDLPESRVYHDGSIALMVPEYLVAGLECPSHGGDDYQVDFQIAHLLLALFALLPSLLGNIAIFIGQVELQLEIVVTLHVVGYLLSFVKVMLQVAFSDIVDRLCVPDQVHSLIHSGQINI